VTLGLYRNRSVERIRGNQATFDNSQRNNLRSCVWVSGVVLVSRLVFISLRWGEKPSLISRSVRVRRCDPDRSFSRGNLCSLGGMRVGRTWIPPRCLHLGRNVGGFIGHSRGVDKIDEVLHAPERGVHQSRLFPRTLSGVLSLRSEPDVVPQDLSFSAAGNAAVLPQEPDRRGRPPAGF